MGEAEELTERFAKLRSELSSSKTLLVLAGSEDDWTTHPLIEHHLLLPPATPLRVPYERLRIGRLEATALGCFTVPSLTYEPLTSALRELVLTTPLWWYRLWNATTRQHFDGDVPLSLSVVHHLILTIPIASFLEGILAGDILFDAPALLAWREATLRQAEQEGLLGLPVGLFPGLAKPP